MEEIPGSTPTKTYTLYLPSVWLTKSRMEVRSLDGETFLWRNKKQQGLFKCSMLEFHSQRPDGPVVAAAEFRMSARSFSYLLGDPDATSLDTWPEVVRAKGWTGRAYEFSLPSQRAMTWKRTHSKDLGASKTGNQDFKLVDESGEVLAVHVNTQRFLKGKIKEFGRLEWFVELGGQDELAALVVLLTIFEDIQREENSAAIIVGASSAAGA